jgi:hypothetical protein
VDVAYLLLGLGLGLVYGPALAYVVVGAARRAWLRAEAEVWFVRFVEKDGVSESRTVLHRSAADAKHRGKCHA